MHLYKKPKIDTVTAQDLAGYLGPQCAGYVTMQSGRTAMFDGSFTQQEIVVCQVMSREEIGLVRVAKC